MLQWWTVIINPLTATDALAGVGGMYVAAKTGATDGYTLAVVGAASAAIGSGLFLIALA